MSRERRPQRLNRRRAIILVGLVVVVAAGGGVVATGVLSGGGSAKNASIDSNAPTATATVTQQKLTSQTMVNGTLGYAGNLDVVNRNQGTITKIASVGKEFKHGDVLYQIDGQPVVFLYGGVLPAYRSLSLDASGADVRQLNSELVKLGYADGYYLDPDSNYFGEGTYYALRHLQKSIGAKVTGKLDLGQAVFLPTEQIRITKVNGNYGGPASSGPIMEATSTDRNVTVAMGTGQASTLHVGDSVTVTLPNLKTTPGKVSSIGTVAQQNSSGSPTVNVIVKLSNPDDTGKLDQAPVQVSITSGTVDNALAIPVNGLLALSGGGYAVEIVQPNGMRKVVPVTVGLFDDGAGLVQINGAGVAAGQKIVVPTS